MELVSWANGKGSTLTLSETERRDLQAFLASEHKTVTLFGSANDSLDIEIEPDTD